MSAVGDDRWINRLLEVGRTLVTELDLDVLLDRVLETAREITGARYAALGILNDRRTELAQFLTSGVDPETHRMIGDLPRGRGVLGQLIDHPEPLRLSDVGEHPSSYGFPAGHPVMRGFLGVPIAIRGQTWGNLYLTEKQDGEFTQRDEDAAVILAEWAAVAIDNARLYETSELRRLELEKAVRGLEATHDIAVAIGGEVALERTLELIAKRGRALIGAGSVVITLREAEQLVVRAASGPVKDALGICLPIDSSTSGQVLERRRPERIPDVSARLRIGAETFGVEGARTALLVPLLHRGEALGVLAAFDRGEDGDPFTSDDEQMLRSFAASAATAVALAQSVQQDRLRSSLDAAESERRRWARELHDETLQGLGGLRVLLSAALRRGDPAHAEAAMREAVERIEQEIGNLRAIITDLRPASLDDLGLRSAIEALIERQQTRGGLNVASELSLPAPAPAERLADDVETAVYRLVQESLTNVVKHAGASTARVLVREADGEVTVEVQDDGGGFDTSATSQGFGLAGMRERVALAGGSLLVESGQAGTLVCARIPVRRRGSEATEAPASAAQQAAS
jgi:signal transduction histidine kinase